MGDSREPKNVLVRVRVTDVAAEKFVFESDDIEIGPDNVITFDNGECHKGFLISYELHGADGYRFPEDLQDALYVKAGSKTYCPQSRSQWGQFQPLEVREGNGGLRRVLLVHNKNDAKQDFAYTLRAKSAGKWLTLDPGGSNQNGDEGVTEPNISTAVIIGAVAAVALLAVAYLAFR